MRLDIQGLGREVLRTCDKHARRNKGGNIDEIVLSRHFEVEFKTGLSPIAYQVYLHERTWLGKRVNLSDTLPKHVVLLRDTVLGMHWSIEIAALRNPADTLR